MEKHKPLYPWSRDVAKRSGQTDLWDESYNENCRCARAIERMIALHYKDNRLNADGAKSVIGEYGYDRVNWVLANTVQIAHGEGRYSEDNRKWSRGFMIPHDSHLKRSTFSVTSHPGLVDIFINQARKEWQALGLYDDKSCYENSRSQLDYKGKVVIIDARALKDEFKTPDGQLFYAKFGNGCCSDALGTKVFGQFLKDGAEDIFLRSEIEGVMKLELLPDWAKEKMAEIKSQDENNTEVENETKTISSEQNPTG